MRGIPRFIKVLRTLAQAAPAQLQQTLNPPKCVSGDENLRATVNMAPLKFLETAPA
jgi:hypothetical protein